MIQLDENYRIEGDAHSWNLGYEKLGDINPKTGKPVVSRDMSYHPTLEHALKAYADKVLIPCESVVEVLAKIAETQEIIKTACAGITKEMVK